MTSLSINSVERITPMYRVQIVHCTMYIHG